MGSYKVCFCFNRKFRCKDAEPPADVKEAFESFSGGVGHMTSEQLLRFLKEFQGDAGATIVDADAIIDEIRHRRHLGKFLKPILTLENFQHYLFCEDLNPPIRTQVHQDMTAPLSHYYIYTGHNSYLTGNQLSSDCSDVPIIKALKRGVRVIELDMWPNSTKDDVDILHGRTFTTPVQLIKCLTSIKEHAFSTSPYPVILTLEDHLTSDLQAKVAEMVTHTFGEMLFIPEAECLEELPSPEALKERIVISTKPPKEYLESKSSNEKDNGSQKEKDSAEEEAWGIEVPNIKAELEDDSKNENDRSEQILEEEDADDCDRKFRQDSTLQYKRLIAIKARKRKVELADSLKVDPNQVTRLSLSEQLIEKAAISHGTDIVRFTQKNLLRIYPKTTRFDSSNYNPFIGWMHGAQMVAFNMQGYGRSLWLMHGMFRANGGCGYVRKPDFLMKIDPYNQVSGPRASFPVKTTLKVKVYMGDGWRMDFRQTHFDTYSPPDFYTRA
ncbi:phosphoinositide phospholipase C 4-like isoform X2 [Tasmannia lanceolata]|uniref:phosphoinositide phospholipase C 4-like isoform X2 n=1 Tax=Tasmannia lanceolata TaxID=3420 RepID=UPI0040641BBD